MRKGKQAVAAVIQTMFEMGKAEQQPNYEDFCRILMNISDSLFDEQVSRFVKDHPDWQDVVESE